jgi:hypothetical protein
MVAFSVLLYRYPDDDDDDDDDSKSDGNMLVINHM